MPGLERVRRGAVVLVGLTAKYPQVAMQAAYMVHMAETVEEIICAIALIDDLETEEESARFEAEINLALSA